MNLAPQPPVDASTELDSAVTDASTSATASGDAGPPDAPSKYHDGATRPPEPDDAATAPCGDLTQCCGRLVISPPLAAACYAPTFQGDAGDPAMCASTLGSFRDAGLCP